METQLTGDTLTSILKALGLVQQPHLGAWEANSRAVRGRLLGLVGMILVALLTLRPAVPLPESGLQELEDAGGEHTESELLNRSAPECSSGDKVERKIDRQRSSSPGGHLKNLKAFESSFSGPFEVTVG